MRLINNGEQERGTLNLIINGVPVFDSSGSGGVSPFYNITAEPPDVTPVPPDDVKLTFSEVPFHKVNDRPDIPGSTTDASPIWDSAVATHAVHVVPENLPVADVDNLVYALPENIVHHLYDSPIEDVNDLTTSLPAPVL